MSRIHLTTAGESHGPYEVCILEGIPSGLRLSETDVNAELARRQQGYGRGGRMSIEADECEFAAGVRLGVTIGSPIAVLVENKDHKNWGATMQVSVPSAIDVEAERGSTVPRPGHADFAGMAKYGHDGLRPVLERASARETVARVAGGAICRRLLAELGVSIQARVVRLGGVAVDETLADYRRPDSVDWDAVQESAVGCEDPEIGQRMCAAIDAARQEGDSLGGVFEVWVWGLCPGLGDNTRFEGRLDGALLGAVGSIPAIKGVEIARAFADADLPGSKVHDILSLRDAPGGAVVDRPTNRAGGLEGGMTNGMPLIVRAAMKPIPTMTVPLPSVDLASMREAVAHVERSDVTAVPAARVVAEAMVALVVADSYVAKFGGDSMEELRRNVAGYVEGLEGRGLWRRA